MGAASFPRSRSATIRTIAYSAIALGMAFAVHDALGRWPFGTLPLSDAYTPVDRLVAMTRLAVLAIAGILIAKKPGDSAVLALAGGLVGTSFNVDWNFGYAQWPSFTIALVVDCIGPAAGLFSLLRLAAHSDASTVTTVGRVTHRAAPYLASAVGAAALLGWGAVVFDVTAHPDSALLPTFEAVMFGAYWALTIVAMAALITAAGSQVLAAPSALRERRLFVLGGLAIYAATQILEAVLRLAPTSNDGAIAAVVFASNAISAVGLLVLAIVLAYALLTRDVLGVDLLVDRSVVLGIVSVVFVSLYYLTEAFVVPTIEAAVRSIFHIDENAEVTKLLVLFPVFFAVHKSFELAEEFVKRYSLGDRERVERLLARTGERIGSMRDHASVERALLASLLAIGAVSARMYLVRRSRARLVCAAGDRSARLGVTIDERLVRTLLRERTGVAATTRDGSSAIVCPMVVGTRLYGFVVVGAKASGAAYAREEIDELGVLVQAAGLAHRALGRDGLPLRGRPARVDAMKRPHHRLDRGPLHAARRDQE